MNIRRTIAIGIIVVGVAVMGYGFISSYQIFIGASEPPQLFQTPPPSQLQGTGDPIQQGIQRALQQQIGNIIPADNITKIFNLAAWFLFAGLLTFGGSQLAGVGIKLLNKGNT